MILIINCNDYPLWSTFKVKFFIWKYYTTINYS